MKTNKQLLVTGVIICISFLMQLTGCNSLENAPVNSDGEILGNTGSTEESFFSSDESEEPAIVETVTTNVVCPEFLLSDGFILPIEQQTTTPDGYIAITSLEEFSKIGLNPSGNYFLMNDLDLTNFEFEMISNFSGIFDGNGHTITNYGHSSPFYSIVDGGKVKNLGISYSEDYEFPTYNIKKIDEVGASGIAQIMENGVLDNCYTTGNIKHTEGKGNIAGLVMYAKSSEIANCYNACNINNYEEPNQHSNAVAGIVYIMQSSQITNCFNIGNLASNHWTGGIIFQTKESATIRDCYNQGDIQGEGGAAGIASYANGNVTIYRCYNAGNVTAFAGAQSYQLGAVGIASSNGSDGSSISDCYNAGKISYYFDEASAYSDVFGKLGAFGISQFRESYYNCCYNVGELYSEHDPVGAICADGNTLEYCYFLDNTDTATPGGALFVDVRQLTDSEMQQESTYKGFDFEMSWRMGNDTYPYPVFCPYF